MAVQTLEIGDEEAPSRPKRLTPKDFILYESTENSSGRCAGLIVIFIVVIFSDILFGKTMKRGREERDTTKFF